jgi:thiol-disulfide isomerase/thioredoxin
MLFKTNNMRFSILKFSKIINTLTIVTSISVVSCSNNDNIPIKVNGIVIEGTVKNLPVKKIYLTSAAKWDVFIDSASVDNNKFKLSLDTSQYNEPFLASICVVTAENKIEQLAVVNYNRTNKKDTFSNTGFMLILGKTELFGDYNDKLHRIAIRPNVENDLLFDSKTEYFASEKKPVFIKETIRKNPFSYFLLQKLFEYKEFYSASELKSFVQNFDKRLVNSETAQNLLKYSDYLLTKGKVLPNTLLNNFDGGKDSLFNGLTKLNMLIFWASWCGPCLLEIPQLKAIRKKYSSEILTMQSISIDEYADKWGKAVAEQQMTWRQLLPPQSDLLKIQAQFSINSVPIVIFADKDRKEIKRFVGFSENNTEEYIKFINEFLERN